LDLPADHPRLYVLLGLQPGRVSVTLEWVIARNSAEVEEQIARLRIDKPNRVPDLIPLVFEVPWQLPFYGPDGQGERVYNIIPTPMTDEEILRFMQGRGWMEPTSE
jgi:hypothetical protein